MQCQVCIHDKKDFGMLILDLKNTCLGKSLCLNFFLLLASEMNLAGDKRNSFNLTTQSGSEQRRFRQRSLRESLEEQEEEESLALMIDHTNAFNSSTLEINVESSTDGSSVGRSTGSSNSSSITRSNNSNQYTLSGSRNKTDLMQV